MKRLIVLLFFLSLDGIAFSAIELSGALRNDAMIIKTTNDFQFNDILENKLVFTRKADDWKFYSDIRLYLLYGRIAEQTLSLGPIVTNVLISYNINLLRTFLRYDSQVGALTVGKTYISFGNTGLLNPLDPIKKVNFNDLNMDKEGILALEYEFSFLELSGGKFYVSPLAEITNSGFGGSLFANLSKFDFGIAANRKNINTNILGVFFKGDLEVGVNATWAYHTDDALTNNFNEACFGLDYSFLDGKLFTGLTLYYYERGATETNKYVQPTEAYFKSRYTLYGCLSYQPDEYLSTRLDIFWNLMDYSALIQPSVSYILSDGLNLTMMFYAVTGRESQEFTRNTLGDYSVLLRMEAKL